MGALTSRGELRDDHLVDQRDVGMDVFSGNAEDLSRRLNGASGLSLDVSDVQSNVCHGFRLPSLPNGRERYRP